MPCRVAARTAGAPSRRTMPPMMPWGVSPGWTMRLDRPSAQMEAATNSLSPWPACSSQSPPPSLSSISRSWVALSGMRNSASASTISASPSRVESANSRRKSSNPPIDPERARMASISAVAVASTRASAAGASLVSATYRRMSSAHRRVRRARRKAETTGWSWRQCSGERARRRCLLSTCNAESASPLPRENGRARTAAYSFTQTPPLALDFTAASMNSMPFRPSSTVGKVTAGSSGVPSRAARMARATSL